MKEEGTRNKEQGTRGRKALGFAVGDGSANERIRKMALRSCIMPGAQRKKEYSDEYYTPPHIVQALGVFDLDPSAGPSSHAKRNVRRPDDGLEMEWKGRVWLNPPYSNIEQWLAKFVAHGNGIALVNARAEAVWFQTLMQHAAGVMFPRGRVRFVKPDGTVGCNPVGSALVALGSHNAAALKASGIPGLCLVHA